MHRSRLGVALIDIDTDGYDAAAAFWEAAIGRTAKPEDEEEYASLGRLDRFGLALQRTGAGTPPRVHLDIETDDVEAEIARVVAPGRGRDRPPRRLRDPGRPRRPAVLRGAGADRRRLRHPREHLGLSRPCRLAPPDRCRAIRGARATQTARDRVAPDGCRAHRGPGQLRRHEIGWRRTDVVPIGGPGQLRRHEIGGRRPDVVPFGWLWHPGCTDRWPRRSRSGDQRVALAAGPSPHQSTGAATEVVPVGGPGQLRRHEIGWRRTDVVRSGGMAPRMARDRCRGGRRSRSGDQRVALAAEPSPISRPAQAPKSCGWGARATPDGTRSVAADGCRANRGAGQPRRHEIG